MYKDKFYSYIINTKITSTLLRIRIQNSCQNTIKYIEKVKITDSSTYMTYITVNILRNILKFNKHFTIKNVFFKFKFMNHICNIVFIIIRTMYKIKLSACYNNT